MIKVISSSNMHNLIHNSNLKSVILARKIHTHRDKCNRKKDNKYKKCSFACFVGVVVVWRNGRERKMKIGCDSLSSSGFSIDTLK